MKNLDSILPISDEGLYPIRTVSEISGVNSITLRAWERRYDLFKPKRSLKGHRLYSEKDIQRIQEVLALLEKGVSIGRVAKALNENRSESDLPSLLSEKTTKVAQDELTDYLCSSYKNNILKSISEFDVLQLESNHHELFSNYPIESIIHKLIFPIFDELKTKAEKHSSLTIEYSFYRIFILYRLGGLCLKTSLHNTGKKLLLMGLKDEHCDIKMLLFALPLLQQGFEVITLGCDVTIDSIPRSLSASNAEGLIIYTNLNQSNTATQNSINLVLNNVNRPIFVTDQSLKDQKNDIEKSNVIFLPNDSNEQITIINKSLNKTTK